MFFLSVWAVAIPACVRSRVIAASIMFLGPLVIEPVVRFAVLGVPDLSGLIPYLKWLPFSSLSNMVSSGYGLNYSGPPALDAGTAARWHVGLAVCAVAVSAVTTIYRDSTGGEDG